MTSPASVWVARFELAVSRFQAERSSQVEPHPDVCRFRRKDSNLRCAGQSRVSYHVERLRNPGRCGRIRTFARGRMKPGILQGAQRKKSGDKEVGDVACCSAAEPPSGGARRAGFEPATRRSM